ncbi:MAG: hypothetical protein U1E27_04255 [Kiritimatiellia bacterium]|nr:hypothetical protein [Kiritimatiellia bacterium]
MKTKSIAKELILENDRIAVRFNLNKGCQLSSLVDVRTGRKALRQTGQLLVAGPDQTDVKSARVRSVHTGELADPNMGPGLSATVILDQTLGGRRLEVVRRIDLPDQAGAIRILDTWNARDSLAGVWYSELGRFALTGKSVRPAVYDWVTCSDQTNHRLIRRSGLGRTSGLLFTIGRKDTGLFFWKEAPAPDSHPVKGEWNFEYRNGRLSIIGTGFQNAASGESRRCDGLVIGLLEDEKSLLGLRRYQHARYYRENLPAAAEWIANSWPAFHLGVDAEKIAGEIERAAECRFDAVTIDDGWGLTFMGEVDRAKFPGGLEALAALAEKRGVHVGLWMNPLGLDTRDPRAKLWDGAECHDTQVETREWNWVARTRDFIPCETYISEGVRGYVSMDLCHPGYRQYLRDRILAFAAAGIRRFKFDLYQLSAYDGMTGDAHQHYEAYRGLLDELKAAGIVIEMDVTRGNRPCFDFGLDYGRLFLENRGRNLKDHRWYEPWVSLANLWDAAHLAPAQLLELEIFPQLPEYPIDYVLATALTTSPLYFGSLSEMNPAQRLKVRAFIESTAALRRQILHGLVVPVGPRPERNGWSGFVSLNPEGDRGILLAYRNGPDAGDTFPFDLSSLPVRFRSALREAGQATEARWNGRRLEVEIKQDLGYAVISLA